VEGELSGLVGGKACLARARTAEYALEWRRSGD